MLLIQLFYPFFIVIFNIPPQSGRVKDRITVVSPPRPAGFNIPLTAAMIYSQISLFGFEGFFMDILDSISFGIRHL